MQKKASITELPDYMAAGDAAKFLGMSRQNWYHSGLADSIPSYKVGKIRLYKRSDILVLQQWLITRKGLIALKAIKHNHHLKPTSVEISKVTSGYWDATCPRCQEYAIADPDTEKVWCPQCGTKQGVIVYARARQAERRSGAR